MILTDEEVRAITSDALWSDTDCHADLCAQVARAVERAVLEKLRNGQVTRASEVAGAVAWQSVIDEAAPHEPDVDITLRRIFSAMIDAATKAGK